MTTTAYHRAEPGPDGLCTLPGCGRNRISHLVTASDLNRGQWIALDSIIAEAKATRGTRFTQQQAVLILVDERRERGILSADDVLLIRAYVQNGTHPSERR